MKGKKFLGVILTLLSLSSLTCADTSMGDYCAKPPFLSTAIEPNVLLLIDVSGSMSWSAYNPQSNKEDWCSNSSGCGWTYTGTEEGYFIPDKVYKLVGGCNSSNYYNCYWEETTSTSVKPCPHTWFDVYNKSGNYRGSCLNFLLMSRIDLLRWAITGGRPKGCDSVNDDDCDPDIQCSGSTCELEAYWGDRVIVPKERINGILQIVEKEKVKPRFGVLFFSSNGLRYNKVYIGDYLNGNDADNNYPYTYLKRAINYEDPSGSTPTAVAMWEAYDYFKQSDDHPTSNDFKLGEGTFKDPMYVCDSNRSNCKLVPCANNFVILASDGQWNTTFGGTSTCSISTGYEDDSADPVVPAYRMHHDVLRTLTSTSGIDFDVRVDKVYTLGLFLGGTGEQSLKNVAVYGSFDTTLFDWPDGTNGTHWNGGGGNQYPWDTCYMDDCGNGRGSACTPLPPRSDDWDANGDGQPDSFFNANSASQMKEYLLRFIEDILKRVSSGSSISVLAEKQKKGATVVQAVFYPEKRFGDKSISWIGHLYQYWFLNTKKAQNLREDTNDSKTLDIFDDYIIRFNVDSSGKLYIDAYSSDTNGNPSTYATTYNSLDEVHHLWDAGENLAQTDESSRTIYGVSETGNMELFTTGNSSKFDENFGTDANEYPECLLDSSGDPDPDKLIRYVRGEDISGCRSRTTDDGDVWKLADIIHSSPITVDYGDYSITFVGANDGMLHAFTSGYIKKQTGDTVAVLCEEKGGICGTSAVLGEEIWAFIPKNVMPYLRYYANPNYCHIYMVDLTPYVIEIDDDGDSDIEQRILVGGFRLGGGCNCSNDECIQPPSDTCPDSSSTSCVGLSSYFALDITNPYNPQFLWEFSHPDLGFSYSGPAHIKRKDGSGNWKHFVMFASGPTSFEGHSEKDLKFFVLDLRTGTLIDEVDKNDDPDLSSLNNSFGGKLFTEGLDVNGDGQTDFVFVGYTKNVGSTSQGGVIKIWTGDANPSNWDYDTNYFNLSNNPTTAKVETMYCFGKYYTFFGTGRYFYKTDNESDINAIYGVPFLCDENNNCETGSINSAHDASSTPLDCANVGDKTQGAWMISLKDDDGAYMKERVISNPTVSNFGAVFFISTRPTGDVCAFGGRTRTWALNCATGAPITDNTCPGATVDLKPFKFLVQLSGGDIKEYGQSDYTEEGGKATSETYGIPSESGGNLIVPGDITKLRILLWLEK